MSLLAVGLSHRSAPTRVLERVAVPPDDLPKVLHDLLQGSHVGQAVVLSTCNRVEVYADVGTFHGGVAEISDQLARVGGLALDERTPHLYVHHEARAVQHLFAVSCGLDSMLVGEAQILGQVRAAFRLARDEGGTGRALAELFQAALRVGKRAHSETTIDAAGASIVGVGVRLAEDALGPLDGRPALLVGAGSVGALAGGVLRRAGVGPVVVANRGPARAARLAAALGGRPVGLDALAAELARADLAVTSTGATGLVLDRATVAAAVAARGRRPLFLLDLALPHDVDPHVRGLPGVTLVDLESLRTVLEGAPAGRDIERARALVGEEVAAFVDRQRALRVAPTVVALRRRAARVVGDELDRLHGRLPELPDRTRAEVEATVRRVVDKLLHAPTVRVQELAEAPGGDAYAEALRVLFDLPREAAAAVSSPDPRELP
ncbi:MAG TPA: glutamyl-tRNA reductase [Frankiaceae bacterium]|nr:glutamyl-tRNA reductase [Frankiaceae bacterium]